MNIEMYDVDAKTPIRIDLVDGKTINFTMSASVGVIPTIMRNLSTTKYLTVWNDDKTICVPEGEIKLITFDRTN